MPKDELESIFGEALTPGSNTQINQPPTNMGFKMQPIGSGIDTSVPAPKSKTAQAERFKTGEEYRGDIYQAIAGLEPGTMTDKAVSEKVSASQGSLMGMAWSFIEAGRQLHKERTERMGKEQAGLIPPTPDGDKQSYWEEATINLGKELEMLAGAPRAFIALPILFAMNEYDFYKQNINDMKAGLKGGDYLAPIKSIIGIDKHILKNLYNVHKGARDLAGLIVKDTYNALRHPARTFKERPITAALDWTIIGDLAKLGTTGLARAYLKGKQKADLTPLLKSDNYMNRQKHYYAAAMDVNQAVSEKQAASMALYPENNVSEFIGKRYRADAYAPALSGKDNVYIVMPGSPTPMKQNPIPRAFAEKLKADFGGEVLEIAKPVHSGKSYDSITALLDDTRAFTVTEPGKILPLRHKNVVIVDDITTTGETAEALARSLHKQGVKTNAVLSLSQQNTSYATVRSLEDFSRSLAEKTGKDFDYINSLSKSSLGNALQNKVIKLDKWAKTASQADALKLLSRLETRTKDLYALRNIIFKNARIRRPEVMLREGMTAEEQAYLQARGMARTPSELNIGKADYSGQSALSRNPATAEAAEKAPLQAKEMLEGIGAQVYDFKFLDDTIDAVNNNLLPDELRLIVQVNDVKSLENMPLREIQYNGKPIKLYVTNGTQTLEAKRGLVPGTAVLEKHPGTGTVFHKEIIAEALKEGRPISEATMEGYSEALKGRIAVHNAKLEADAMQYLYEAPERMQEFARDARAFKTFEDFEKDGAKYFHGTELAGLDAVIKDPQQQFAFPSIGISKDPQGNFINSSITFLVPKEIFTSKNTLAMDRDFWSVTHGHINKPAVTLNQKAPGGKLFVDTARKLFVDKNMKELAEKYGSKVYSEDIAKKIIDELEEAVNKKRNSLLAQIEEGKLPKDFNVEKAAEQYEERIRKNYWDRLDTEPYIDSGKTGEIPKSEIDHINRMAANDYPLHSYLEATESWEQAVNKMARDLGENEEALKYFLKEVESKVSPETMTAIKKAVSDPENIENNLGPVLSELYKENSKVQSNLRIPKKNDLYNEIYRDFARIYKDGAEEIMRGVYIQGDIEDAGKRLYEHFYNDPRLNAKMQYYAQKYGIKINADGELDFKQMAKLITNTLPETAKGKTRFVKEFWGPQTGRHTIDHAPLHAKAAKPLTEETLPEAVAKLESVAIPDPLANIYMQTTYDFLMQEGIPEIGSKTYDNLVSYIAATIEKKGITANERAAIERYLGEAATPESIARRLVKDSKDKRNPSILTSTQKGLAKTIEEQTGIKGIFEEDAAEIFAGADTAAINKIFTREGVDIGDMTKAEAIEKIREISKEAFDYPVSMIEAKSFEAHSVNEFPAVIIKPSVYKEATERLKKLGYEGEVFKSWQEYYNKMTSLKKNSKFQNVMDALDIWANRLAFNEPEVIKINRELSMPVKLSENPLVREFVERPLLRNQGALGTVYKNVMGLTESKQVAKLMQELNAQHIFARQAIMGQLQKDFKLLSKYEKEIFAPFIEGRIAVKPEELSENMVNLIIKYKGMIDKQAKALQLPPEVIEGRKYLMHKNKYTREYEPGQEAVFNKVLQAWREKNVKSAKGEAFPGYNKTAWAKRQQSYWGDMAREEGRGGRYNPYATDNIEDTEYILFKRNIPNDQKTSILSSQLHEMEEGYKAFIDEIINNPGLQKEGTLDEIAKYLHDIDELASFEYAPKNRNYLDEAMAYTEKAFNTPKAREASGLPPGATLEEIRTHYNKIREQAKAAGMVMIDEPIYYPHVFDKQEVTTAGKVRAKEGRMQGESFGDYLVSYLRRAKSSFLKKAKGVQGYSENVEKVLPYHFARVMSYENSERFFKTMTDFFALEMKPGEKIREGYVEWYPSGMLKMVRKTIDLEDEILKKAERLGDKELEDTLRAALDDLGKDMQLTRDDLIAKREKVYQIPVAVMDEMRRQTTAAWPFVRAIYDPLLNAWRHSVLYMRPAWVVYNIVGNEVFKTMAGILPWNRVNRLHKNVMRKIPSEALGPTFVAEQRFGTGKMGRAGEWTAMGIPIGKVSADIQKAVTDIWQGNVMDFATLYRMAPNKQKFLETIKTTLSTAARPLKTFEDFVLATNEYFEHQARAAVYLKTGQRLVKKDLEELGAAGYKAYKKMKDLDVLDYLEANPMLKREAIDEVNYFLNDYTKKGLAERLVFRRLFPFISFTKHVIKLFASYPFRHPKKAWLFSRLAMIEEEIRDDVKRESGILEEIGQRPWFTRGAGAVDLPFMDDPTTGKKGYFYPGYMNPFESVTNLGTLVKEQGNPLEALQEMGLGLPSSPLLGALITQLTKTDPFTRRPFEREGRLGNMKLDGDTLRRIEAAGTQPGYGELLLRSIPQYKLYYDLFGKGAGYPLYTGEPLSAQKIKGSTWNKPPRRRWLPIARYFGAPLYEYLPERQDIGTYQQFIRTYPSLIKQQELDKIRREEAEIERLRRR